MKEMKNDDTLETMNTPEKINWSKTVVLLVSKNVQANKCRIKVNVQGFPSKLNGKPGKSLLGTQEADIRTKSEATAMKKIWDVPLRKKCSMRIVQGIMRAFGDQFGLLDLKTAWLVLREYSEPIRGHDEEAFELFCNSRQDLADLTFAATFEQLEAALKKVLNRNVVPQKYWRFLKMMANQATTKLKLLKENPLDAIWKYVELADSRGKNKIVEALRDWCFNSHEMDRMVLPLLETVEIDGNTFHLYEVDSHVTMKLFVVFGLIHKDELCALNFEDIEFLSSGDAQVRVTKYLDKHGRVNYYNDSERRQILCRKSVLTKLLRMVFEARQKRVKKTFGFTGAELKTIPVFWEKEVDRKTKIKRITLKTAGQIYDQLIECAKGSEFAEKSCSKLAINPNDVTSYIDIGISRSTEFVFINNIKIWTESLYGIENGELAYNSGVDPLATIDRHYIAWYALFNLVATAGKMDRFVARYTAMVEKSNQQPLKLSLKMNDASCSYSWTAPADKHGQLRLEIPIQATPFQVTIDTYYGHTIEATLYTQER